MTTSRIQSHLELFNQFQYAHGALKFAQEEGEADQAVFRYLQVTRPPMADTVDLSYGIFSDAVQQVAVSFGCRAQPCDSQLRDKTLSPEIAFAMVLHVIDRTAPLLTNDKQLKQLIAPALALTNLIKRWGVVIDDRPLTAPAFTEQSLLMARMAFRRQGHELDQFNEKNALAAIDKACKKALDLDELNGLPQRAQFIFVNSKIKRVGYTQGLTQAANLAILKTPDNQAYHQLDPTNY